MIKAHGQKKPIDFVGLFCLPRVKEVARELREINDFVGEWCDVRLQVYHDGEWVLHFGPPEYDTDHRGYWGISSVPGNGKRFNSLQIARDLLFEVENSYNEE